MRGAIAEQSEGESSCFLGDAVSLLNGIWENFYASRLPKYRFSSVSMATIFRNWLIFRMYVYILIFPLAPGLYGIGLIPYSVIFLSTLLFVVLDSFNSKF